MKIISQNENDKSIFQTIKDSLRKDSDFLGLINQSETTSEKSMINSNHNSQEAIQVKI